MKKITKKTQVLFIIFNRPDATKRVFAEIRKYKPTKLFVAADGPRETKSGEKDKCGAARKLTENIDWPCEVKRLYRNKNLGCKLAVSEAITWFFENVEEGIILEDDCLPDPSFFKFCEEMLDTYKNDENIMHITGDNYQGGVHRGEQNSSYYFSIYPHIWGWATWKRAWNKYSLKIDMKSEKLRKTFSKMRIFEKIYWGTMFWCVNHNLVNTWDYQWVYAIWKNSGICITPNRNLVINIGIGNNSTHTKRANHSIDSVQLESVNKVIHPRSIIVNTEADRLTSQETFDISLKNLWKILLVIPYNILKNL